MTKFPSVDDLKTLAEQEFINAYGLFPTCAVFAPGCLTLAGKSVDIAGNKTLSMAIQLVTLVVGKPNYTSKWCHFKTLSGKIAGKKFKLRMNDANLHVFAEDPRLIRYLKGTLRSFKTKRAYVPGFQIVIASSLPMKRGLGSGSALVVALYTFLERITNIYTGNIVEKTLACHFAQKLAAGTSNARISDVLTSVIGSRGQIFALDVRSLGIDRCHWNAVDVELVLIELASDEKDRLSKCWNADEPRNGEISIVTKMMSRWRTHPIGASMMNLLFSSKCMETSKAVLEEDNRITQMTDAIRKERWDELGKLLWESHRRRSADKYLSCLSNDIERTVNTLVEIEGVLGISVISYSARSIVILVQKSKLKVFISFLNRMKLPQQYYILKACTGATTMYAYEPPPHPSNIKYPSRPKLIIKYHFRERI